MANEAADVHLLFYTLRSTTRRFPADTATEPAMGMRIRGHYRIDADGRIIPIVEKHDWFLDYAPDPSGVAFGPTRGEKERMYIELCVVCVIISILITAPLFIIPLQRAVLAVAAAQAAQAAATRGLR